MLYSCTHMATVGVKGLIAVEIISFFSSYLGLVVDVFSVLVLVIVNKIIFIPILVLVQ